MTTFIMLYVFDLLKKKKESCACESEYIGCVRSWLKRTGSYESIVTALDYTGCDIINTVIL